MFCQKCGAEMPDNATACPKCGASVVAAAAHTSAAAVTSEVKAASREALGAFKSLAGNPVGGLAPAYESLGEAKALRVGVAFGVVSLICFLLGQLLTLQSMARVYGSDVFHFLGFGAFLKCIVFAAMPFICMAAGSVAVRKICGAKGGTGGDCLIAGTAALPGSMVWLLSGVLGYGNYDIIMILEVFAGCFGVLLLFAGYTRIGKLSDRAGSIAVPIVVILGVWLSRVIYMSVLTGGGFGPGMPPNYRS